MIHFLLPAFALIALAKPMSSPPPPSCPAAVGVVAVGPKDYFARGLQGSSSSAPDVIQTTDGSVFITLAKAGMPSDATWTVSPSLDGGTHDFVKSPVERVDVSQSHTDVNITLHGTGLPGCSFWVDFMTLDAVEPTTAPALSASATAASPAPTSLKTAASPAPSALPAPSPAPAHLVAVLACTPWGPEHLDKATTQVELSPAVHIVDPYLSYAPAARCVRLATAKNSLKVLRVSGRVALGAVTSRTPGYVDVTPLSADRTQVKSTLTSQQLRYQLPPNGSYLSPTFSLVQLVCAPTGLLNPQPACIANALLWLPPNMTVANRKWIKLESGTPFTTFATNFNNKSVRLDWETPTGGPAPSKVTLTSVSLSLVPTAVPLKATASIVSDKGSIVNVTSVGVIPYETGPRWIKQTGSVEQVYRPIAKFNYFPASPQPARSPSPVAPTKTSPVSPSPVPTPEPLRSPTGFELTKVDGEFDSQSEPAVDLTVSGKFKIAIVQPSPSPLPSTSPKSATARPVPVPSPIVAALNISGVSVKTTIGKLNTPDDWTDFSFRNAYLDNANGQSFLGHKIDSCETGDSLPKSLPQLKDTDLCFKLALEPGTTRSATNDNTLFAVVTVADCSNKDKDALPSCPTVRDAKQRFALKSLSAAPSEQIAIRFGAGVLNVESMQLDFADQAPGDIFNATIGKSRLAELRCDYTPIVGSATISAMTVNGTATSVLGIGSNAVAQLAGATNGSIYLSGSPQLAIGPNCTAFAMSGYLPLQPSLQSSLILTRLVYVHSVALAGHVSSEETRDYVTYPKQDRTFMEIGGAFTSGNVTIVINSLSLRTLAPGDACPTQNETEGVKEWRLLSGTCVLADINWNASAKITGIENTSTIVKTVENVLSGIVGYLAHAVKI